MRKRARAEDVCPMKRRTASRTSHDERSAFLTSMNLNDEGGASVFSGHFRTLISGQPRCGP